MHMGHHTFPRTAWRIPAMAFAAMMVADASLAAESSQPPELGVWYNQSGKGGIEIQMCGKGLCGRVVWMREPFTQSGRPMYDGHNPDPAKRSRQICGLTTISNLKRMTDGTWGDGQAYNPEEGKTYDVSVRLGGPNQLNVTGSVLFFSKTVYWKRAPGDLPRCADLINAKAAPADVNAATKAAPGVAVNSQPIAPADKPQLATPAASPPPVPVPAKTSAKTPPVPAAAPAKPATAAAPAVPVPAVAKPASIAVPAPKVAAKPMAATPSQAKSPAKSVVKTAPVPAVKTASPSVAAPKKIAAPASAPAAAKTAAAPSATAKKSAWPTTGASAIKPAATTIAAKPAPVGATAKAVKPATASPPTTKTVSKVTGQPATAETPATVKKPADSGSQPPAAAPASGENGAPPDPAY